MPSSDFTIYPNKMEKPPKVFGIFLKIYLYLRDTVETVEKHSEIRYRLITLLFIRI